MGRMSELHDDLGTIHQILLGQKSTAIDWIRKNPDPRNHEYIRLCYAVEVLDNLLIEIEAAGVVWPDNVVELNILGTYCTRCANGNRVEVCGCGKDTVTPSATADACPVPTLVKCNECEGRGNLRFIKGDCMHCGGSGKVQDVCDCGGDVHPEHGPWG